MSAYDRAFDKAVDELLKDARLRALEDMAHGVVPNVYERLVGNIQTIDAIMVALEDIRKKLGSEN